MGFDSLLGNETVKQRLSSAFRKGQPSHCYLITGPKGSGKRTLAKLLMAAMQCTEQDKPCGQCPQCHKVLHDVHPDVIVVDDPEKVNISIKQVRESCADLYIRPNEGKKKIYLFPRAQALRADSQNTLLKCIEEPPSYGAFLFLCEHSEKMLQTIRSRCVELRMTPLSESILRQELTKRFPESTKQAIEGAILRSGGYLGQAMELLTQDDALLPQSVAFVEAFGNAAKMLRLLVPMEKLKRDQLSPILAQWYQLLTSALARKSAMPAIREESEQLANAASMKKLLDAVQVLKYAQTLSEANVSSAHICGMLAVRL